MIRQTASRPFDYHSEPKTASGSELERLLVIAAVFLSPMNYFRTDLAFFTLADLTATAAVVVMVANGRLPLRPFADVTSFWLFSVLLFCGGLMFGSVLALEPIDGAIGIGQYTFSFVLMPLVLLGRPPRETVFLCKVLAVSLAFVMLHAILYSVFFPDDITFFSRSGRLTGLIERENEAGLMAAIGITISVWLYFTKEISLLSFLALLATLAYGLLLSASNSGLLIAFSGMFGIMVFCGSPRHVLVIVGAGVAGLAAMLLFGEYFLPEIFLKRVYGALVTGDTSQAGTFDDRVLLIRESLHIINRSIFTGIGVDQYRLVSDFGAPVHNTYLLIFAEGGVFSLLGLAGMLSALLFIAWRASKDVETRWAGVLLLTILLMFVIALNGLAHVYARFMLVPLLLAVAVCLSGFGERTSARRKDM